MAGMTLMNESQRPPQSYWNLFTFERDCEDELPPLMGQCITTVITDFIVFILPMPTLYSLRLPTLQRVALLAVFGFGLIVVVASAMRTYWVYYVVGETFDVTWEGFSLWIWTAVETNLGVICGCVPALKPLFFGSSWNRQSTPMRNTYIRNKQSDQSGGTGQTSRSAQRSRLRADMREPDLEGRTLARTPTGLDLRPLPPLPVDRENSPIYELEECPGEPPSPVSDFHVAMTRPRREPLHSWLQV